MSLDGGGYTLAIRAGTVDYAKENTAAIGTPLDPTALTTAKFSDTTINALAVNRLFLMTIDSNASLRHVFYLQEVFSSLASAYGGVSYHIKAKVASPSATWSPLYYGYWNIAGCSNTPFFWIVGKDGASNPFCGTNLSSSAVPVSIVEANGAVWCSRWKDGSDIHSYGKGLCMGQLGNVYVK